TTSQLMTEHFSQCFAISKDACVECSYPRNYIFKLDDEERSSYISKYESPTLGYLIKEFEKYKKIYLYMPTWRDSGKDFFQSLSLDFNRINESMKNTNALFLFKPHPATKIPHNFNNLSNVKLMDSKTDIYPIMPKIDSFITDYSSVYYDWLLLSNKDFIFYIPDLNEYMSTERDIAFPFDDNTEGLKITDFESFIAYLNGKTKWDPHQANDHLAIIRKRFWGNDHHQPNQLDEFINKIAKLINTNLRY
ncbi:MAG: hypothetical protein HDS72_08775, partial [Bacteroidales bacterium]|nr:hypothetical protein [Bacteroidales bacterium]